METTVTHLHSQNPLDSMVFSLSKHGPDFRLSRNFTLKDFASKDGADEVVIHPALLILLQRICDHYGRRVTLTSAYRSPAHNKAVGGAPQSTHLKGMGADVVVEGVDPVAVAKVAKAYGAGGVKGYTSPRFTHMDVGRPRTW